MEATGVRPGTNVLVQCPSLSSEKRETCHSLLGADSADDVDVLRVSYSASPAEFVEQWRADHDELPARTYVVDVGERAGLGDDAAETPSDSVAVARANPNDITGLGMRLNTYLTERDADRPLVACFDSLTELLQFTDVQTAFKFLHMFAGQLRAVDAAGHFHLDPAAHDEQTIRRLQPLFDDAVDRT